MPEDAVYVGRPTRWGNPFTLSGDWIVWAAVALGYRADAPGRRAAAVALHRAWITDTPPTLGPYAADDSGGELEFSDGTRRSFADHARGVAAFATSLSPPPVLPDPPALDELRGKDLACWCPLERPCHADVLLELVLAAP